MFRCWKPFPFLTDSLIVVNQVISLRSELSIRSELRTSQPSSATSPSWDLTITTTGISFSYATHVLLHWHCLTTWVFIWCDISSMLPLSQRRYPLVGLDLLRLLSQNKIAQFHTVLEGLVKEHGKKNIDIRSRHPQISCWRNLPSPTNISFHCYLWCHADLVNLQFIPTNTFHIRSI